MEVLTWTAACAGAVALGALAGAFNAWCARRARDPFEEGRARLAARPKAKPAEPPPPEPKYEGRGLSYYAAGAMAAALAELARESGLLKGVLPAPKKHKLNQL